MSSRQLVNAEREPGASTGELLVDDGTDDAHASDSLVGSSGLVYRPLKQLAEGGMAQVFLACAYGNADFSKLVVLKMMRTELGHTHVRDMFLEEARVSARLNHPNLVQVYEVVDSSELPFIVMEYLEGKPLTQLRGGMLPREMLLTIVSEALVGLHYAHEAADFDGRPLKLVHRDVSPHNIFVTYDGAVKILDFGIAKTVTGKGHTQTGEVKGKLRYMAPEQLLGDDLDRRADIFSMGAVLWEMMLGSTLWAKVEQGVLFKRLASGDIPRPGTEHNLDPELEAILIRATAAEPDQRYETALAMQQAVDAYRAKLGEPVSPRDVGRALASRFEGALLAERAAIRTAIAAISRPPVADTAGEVGDGASGNLRQRLGLWLIGVAVVMVLALIVSTLLRSKAPAAPAAPTNAAPAPSEPAARSAHLYFRVDPQESQVRIDGVPRGSGNFELVVAADSLEHELLVTAPGYAPLKQAVRFEGTQTLNLTLSAQTAPAATSAAETPAAHPKSLQRTPKLAPTRAGDKDAEPHKDSPGPACDPPYYFKDGIKTFRQECL